MMISRYISAVITGTRRILKVAGWGGKGDIRTAKEVAPFGIDSSALENMEAIYMASANGDAPVVMGYINKGQLAAAGECRMYSKDSSGNLVTYIWLHNAGGAGQIELGGTADNAVGFNNLKIEFNKLNSKFNDLVSAFNSHVHATAAVGPPSTPTPVPSVIPASPSAANIDNSKKNEIKTL